MSIPTYRPVADGVYQHKGNVIVVDTARANTLGVAAKKPRLNMYVGVLPDNWRLCEAIDLPAPDWSQAPNQAQWWAVDASGYSYWYEDEPERDQEDHFWSGHSPIFAGDVEIPLGIDWRLLKEQRPKGGD